MIVLARRRSREVDRTPRLFAPAAVALALSFTLLVSGCSAAAGGSDAGVAADAVAGAPTSGADALGASDAGTAAGAAGAAGAASADASRGAVGHFQDPQLGTTGSHRQEGIVPVRVQIPSIGVDSGLETLARDDTGWIQPPVDFSSAGWYSEGVVPGDIGPAVIAGHIDSSVGPAVFAQLSSLVAGAAVTVVLSDGSTVGYVVTSEREAPKAQFPTSEVYGPTPDAQLRLITCGGVWDEAWGHYVDNVIVSAVRA